MRIQTTFGALVALQILHSLEEYVFRLYEVFPPAQALSGLVSRDLERGFLIINLSLIAFGVFCYGWPVRRGWPSAVALAWLWVGIELLNGIGHPAWAALQRRYTPGLVTSLVLLVLALLLAGQLFTRAESLFPPREERRPR